MLIEARWYSPTDYQIHHYGLIEAPTFQDASAKMKAAGKSLKLGPEPISFKEVKDPSSHDWGKGFSVQAGDLSRRLA